MALKEVNSDIFLVETDGIIHQANCFGKFGGGFANIIRQKYPEVLQADNTTKCGDKAKLGRFSCIKSLDNKYYIYNLYSQYNYGVTKRHTDYEAFYTGIVAIEAHARNLNLNSLSVPFNIGCGLGGGSWNIIEAMLRCI
jgi:O-acetyl-ADP-ribose deacetylase (regulator of RNase III)